MTLYPGLAIFDYLILSEALFATLVAAAAWAYVRMFSRSSLPAALAAGVFTSLAALTRSVVYPLPVVMAAVALVAGSAGLGVVSPWQLRCSSQREPRSHRGQSGTRDCKACLCWWTRWAV